MKILALDTGDVWVGTAISDGAGITCRPYKTVKLDKLVTFIKEVVALESIGTIVVGHPITAGGTASEQTKKVEALFAHLQQECASCKVTWVLWDERFSSQRAKKNLQIGTKKKARDKENKEHSIAAAYILQNYLDSRSFLRE